MEEVHASCDNHTYDGHIKHRSRCVFSLIFIPITIFLIRQFVAEQLLNRASAYEASSMHQESMRQYKKALFIDGDNADGWNSLADVYKLVRDMDGAMRAYEKALEAEPRNRKALYSLGMIFALDKQQYEEAIKHWDQVRKLGPESVDEKSRYRLSYHSLSLHSLVTGYRRLNDTDRAEDILEELNSYYPDARDVDERTQASEGNSSDIGAREKSDTSP